MQTPPTILIIAIVIIGVLTGSTAYYYSKSRVTTNSRNTAANTFDGTIPTEQAGTSTSAIDTLAKPADPKGRLSYPANSYTIQPKESLAKVGAIMNIPWQTIKLANGIANENVIQAGMDVVVPVLNTKTDYYRVNFMINEDKATELNIQLRTADTSDYYDPIKVAKTTAVPYFNVATTDTFTLVEQDKSKGTALVQAKKDDTTSNLIGLVQPKNTGDKGLWALLYIEHHDSTQ